MGCVTAALLLAAGWSAAAGAMGNPVRFLDGDPSFVLPGSEDLLFTQVVPGRVTTEFGSALAAGDVNGDGFADVVVGQRTENKVFIYLGRAAPAAAPYAADPNAADIVITAPSGTSDRIQQFGFSVAAFDLDGDGYAEIIVGAPFSDPGGHTDQGLAYVILGHGSLATGQSFTLAAPPAGVSIVKLTRGAAGRSGDLLGFAVGGGALDPNNASSYLAVTARDADATAPSARTDSGAVHIAMGSAVAAGGPTFDLTAGSAATIFGIDASDAFGEAVAACDVDGSGAADLLVGAIFGDGPGNAGLNRGEVHLFLGEKIASGQISGTVSAAAADMTIHGATDGDDLGFSVACGDLDGDGMGDVVAGAPYADSIADPNGQDRPTAGELYVVRGRSPLPASPIDLSVVSDPNGDPAPDGADLALFGATTADQLGFSAGVADLDGDGFGDLIAGARRYDRDQTLSNVGAVYLLTGSPGLLDPALSGLPRGIDLHRGTARTVDLNYDPNIPVDHLPDRVDGIVIGASRDDHAGWSVAAGDLDGDGIPDLMISAIGDLARTPGFRGEVYTLFVADHDGDGVSDMSDRDDDNDGIPDADELAGTYTGGVPTDPLNPDTDGDGIQDGTELGFTCVGGGGFVEVACDDPNAPLTSTNHSLALFFRPDADPSTRTDPLDVDSDDDGLADGAEDANDNGRADAGETDAADADTDGDLIFDGTEVGLMTPLAATNLAAGHFVADADGGASTTDPTKADTDGDGIRDGIEDADHNGAVAGDTNLDHVVDAAEVWRETDPTDPDTDRDGLPDGIEDRDHDGVRDAGETDPLDQDTDDDGLPDGRIDGANGAPVDGLFTAREGEDLDLDGVYGPADGESSPLSADSDGDGLKDGVEVGLGPGAGVNGRNGTADSGPGEDGTDRSSVNFALDGDAGVTTTRAWDADTDDDGLPDGFIDGFNPNAGGAPGGVADGIASVYEGEDIDLDGVLDPGETDPLERDSDVDGVKDGEERGVTAPGVLGPDGLPDPISGGVQDGTSGQNTDFDTDETTVTDAVDGDTDDDGLSDGTEDVNDDGAVGPGETDPNDPDSDHDLLTDGLERGRTTGVTMGTRNDTDPSAGHFTPDQDPNTTTNPVKADTDGGGATDGAEDVNLNGRVDVGERNPNDRRDDDPSAVLEFTEGLNGAAKVTPIAAGDTIYLKLDDDTDANLDPNVLETVTVLCAGDTPPDSETVTLTAVAPNSGVFAGSLPTNTTDPNIPGELTVASGDTITCTYTDPTVTPPATISAALTAPAPIPEFDVDLPAGGTVAWSPVGPPGLLPPAMTYNLYRGDLMTLRATGVYTQDALCGLSQPFTADTEAPAPGAALFYLAAGVSGGAEGPLGSDSSGRPRPSTEPCAP